MDLKIGITYDLFDEYRAQGYSELEIAEFDSIDTIENIEQNLQRMGYATERVGNARHLMGALVEGRRWDLVFNICEGLSGTGREALVPSILDCYEIPYTFSDPMSLTLSLHKDMAKHVMCSKGITTPPFVLVESEDDIDTVTLPYPLFAKPACEGTSKGVEASSHVETPAELRGVCEHLLRQYERPVLVETYLPGREFTVGVIGRGAQARVIGGMEIILREGAEPYAYTFRNKQNWETQVEYRPVSQDIVDACARIGLPAWHALSCRDAGRIDLRADADGAINIIEVNPLPGLNEYRSDLSILCRLNNISYSQLLDMIMDAVLERLGPQLAPARKSLQPSSSSA